MQVKSIAECSAVLLTCIKLLEGFKAFDLSIFEWQLKTGFTVCAFDGMQQNQGLCHKAKI